MVQTQPASIWLIGGAAGTGKSSFAYPLAVLTGVPILEIDDLVEALLAMTEPDEQPTLHYWRTHPEAVGRSPTEIVKLQVAVARAIEPAIEAVLANHLKTHMPLVIEGDYLLPSTVARTILGGVPAGDRVRSVILSEPDEAQLVRNFAAREPDEPDQVHRAQVSQLFGSWLAGEA